ncbi:HK97 family phage prohead protease [Carboxylicivirga marina]|uniref:HK97 family phage prohead protease n=1 Tax=Carboxylicivirga marina TaxID=2800988 RepID=A0ABS1HHE9_9BACT|nr:HK97 family phage prohead protease [Carboxylicivirga marina]MBK3516703.1 HK97 family phage prohead protease [Carboxylicivirga marina]
MKNNKLVLVRQDSDGNNLLSWYPIVFGQLSHNPINYADGVSAYERIHENALATCDMSNTKAVVHHDNTKILGRTSAGTLTLAVDEYGLLATVNMGKTQLHQDTLEQVSRGDLFEGSFLGTCTSYRDLHQGETPVREIMVIDKLKDVAIVTDAAYKGAIILKRSNNENSETMTEAEKKAKEQAEELKRSQEAAEKAKADKLELERKLATEQEAKKKAETEAAKANAELKRKQDEEKAAEELKRKAAEAVSGDYLKLVRKAADEGGSVLLERAAGDGSTATEAQMIPKAVAELSIKGKQPIWEQLNTNHFPNAVGTINLPYRSPKVGERVAELAAYTKDTVSPLGNLLTGKRFGHTFQITVETLAAAGDAYFQKLIVDGMKAADRAFDKYIYEKLLAGASEVAEANAYDDASFNALQEAVDSDGETIALSTKKAFFKSKGAKLDAGSGKFLVTKSGANKGETHDGIDYFFSTNFAEAANEEHVVMGDLSAALATADWNKTEVIVDKITGAKSGIINITVNKIMDAALANPTVVVKSADLDPNA